MSGWRERVRAEADGAARMYLHGLKEGQPTSREQKEVIEGILAPDYDGRTVIELLQNGHDAHDRRRSDGTIDLLLERDEGDHGVLYIANGGAPITSENFAAMCRIAMSTKPPQEGIGNKGVGFKSVLQLTPSPEIYSRSDPGSPEFDGFCFRFARDTDFDAIAHRVDPHRQGFPQELRENVANLKLPVAIEDQPPGLPQFNRPEVATVIRLVLASASARKRVLEQIAVLTDSDVPIHLFLDRVSNIGVRVTGEEPFAVQLERREVGSHHVRGAVMRTIHLQDDSSYLVLDRAVPEDLMRAAIATSRDDGRLGSAWDAWEDDALVSIAVPIDHPLDRGRLYTFLPMAPSAQAPLPAFVNAPFFAGLDREHLKEAIPLNDLLLAEAARLAADVLVHAADGELELPAGIAVDLACWRSDARERLAHALDHVGTTVESVPFVPVLGRDDRAPLSEVISWLGTGTVFNPASLANAGEDRLVSPALETVRRHRLLDLATSLGLAFRASAAIRAGFAERLAEHLAETQAEPSTWADLYDDLSTDPDLAEALTGRRILIGENGGLHACGGARGAGAVVFIPPSGIDEDADGTPPVAVPEAVTQRMVFLWPAIDWLNRSRQQRPGRTWLESKRLARPYQTAPVLSAVGEVMGTTDVDDQETLATCLSFAFQVWSARTRDVGADVMGRAGLRVPTAEGWLPAARTVFGPGWPGPKAGIDRQLADLVTRAESTAVTLPSLSGRMVPPAHELDDTADPHQLRTFLELLGVRHGLVPRRKAVDIELTGDQVGSPSARLTAPRNIPQDQWRALVNVAKATTRPGPLYGGVHYRPERQGVYALPCQDRWEQFDDTTRTQYAELILIGLDEWDDEVLTFRWTRSTDTAGAVWPSFVGSFLATTAWLPQTTPGNRRNVSLESVEGAWWFKGETRRFLPAQPPALRKLATDQVLRRLRTIGLRVWEDESTARARLDALVDVVAGTNPGSSPPAGIESEYTQAWLDFVAIGAVDIPERLIVRTEGVLRVRGIDPVKPNIYVDDPAGSDAARLLRQTDASVLAVRGSALAPQIYGIYERNGVKGLRSARDVTWRVIADHLPAHEAPSRPLADVAGIWLADLVLGATAFDERDRPPVHPTLLAEDQRRLADLRVVLARNVEAWVDGYEARSAGTNPSLIVDTGNEPRIVAQAEDLTDQWGITRALAPALAQFVERRCDPQRLRLALFDLERRCAGRTPVLADLAAALAVPADELAGHIHELATWEAGGSLVGVVALCDVAVAEALREAGPFEDESSVINWLEPRLTGETSATDLIELASSNDLLAAMRHLGVGLADANAALRTIGLDPLHNHQGHQGRLEKYKQDHRSDIADKLRDRFTRVASSGTPLDGYVGLMDELANIKPDPAWLDQYWEVPDSAVGALLERWIDEVCPPIDGQPEVLDSVAELRTHGATTVARVVPRLAPLIHAWLSRHPAVGQVPLPSVAAITKAMTADGSLDFGRIGAGDVLRWLSLHDQWPSGMPQSTKRRDLGLSADEVDAARRALKDGREVARRSMSAVEFGGKAYGSDAEDRRALAQAVADALQPGLIATPWTPLDVEPAAGGLQRSGGSGGGGGGRFVPPPPDLLASIGFIGEVIVGAWIEEQFGATTEATWRSGNRDDVFADGIGDDSLGYDFLVEQGEKRLLIEVKTTTDDRLQFQLGETEVARANSLKASEEYLIVLVTNARDPAKQRIMPLPNPFSPGGLANYRIAGRNLRLEFVPRVAPP